MQALVDFVCVDGYALSFANLVSFFGFCIIVGSFTMMVQAVMSIGRR